MKNKKRVLLVSPSALNNGGVQYVLMNIVRNLSCDYIFDIIVFNNEQNFYRKEFLSYGGNIYYVTKNEGKNIVSKFICWLKNKKNLIKICKKIFFEFKYDIVHCCNGFNSSYVLKVADKFNVPNRIVHCHGNYPKTNIFRDLIRKHIKNSIFRYSTSMISCSNIAGKSFFKKNSPFQVIYAPVSSDIVFFDQKPNILTICQIGLYSHNKNQAFTIDVFQHLIKKIDSRLIFVGNGSNESLKQKAKNANLFNKIEFLESSTNKNTLFKNTTYFIFPSLSEGFGISLIEAQKAGVACFASDVVPKETDCGGVQYLSLDKGPEYWATKIFEQYKIDKGQKQEYNCEKFSLNRFIKDINALYLKH